MLSNGSKQVRNVLYLLLTLLSLNLTTKAALFDECDYTFPINAGTSILESPDYPYSYPSGTSCRYNFEAPRDYEITVNCTLTMDKGADACSSEFFYIARDGDKQLRDSEQFCGSGIIVRKSLFRTIVLAYVSYGSWGAFRCSLQVTPQPCDCGWSVNTKIVNGQETTINEYSSMVALKDKTSTLESFCGATIIASKFLITACHCTRQQENPGYIEAWVGDHSLSSNTESKYAAIYQIKRIIEHPLYTNDPVNNDIAILETTTYIEWSRGVSPICLPPNDNIDFSYNNVDVCGWGTTSFGGPKSTNLLKITVIIQNHQTCVDTYKNETTIYPSQMCTYDSSGSSKDSCQYDSGGPVILRLYRQFLLGIVSFGKICGQGGYATGVNTQVSSYLQWIYENTGYSTCNKSF